jgi:hypothetical protein
MHCSKKYNALVIAPAPIQTELQLSCYQTELQVSIEVHLKSNAQRDVAPRCNHTYLSISIQTTKLHVSISEILHQLPLATD